MNLSTSGPKLVSQRCRERKQMSPRVPAGTKIGDFPSAPLPVGSLVSTSEMRPRTGKTGYNRRAANRIRYELLFVTN